MQKTPVIHWFRQDLRLSDNPALFDAVQAGHIIPLYILDDDNAGDHKLGGASRVWLHHSLNALNDSLGGGLWVRYGDAQFVLNDIINTYNVSAVYYNRCYEPWRVKRDIQIKQSLKSRGVGVYSYNGSLLWEPWDISKPDGTPYKVFTPFYRRGCLNAQPPREPLPRPNDLQLFDVVDCGSVRGCINDLQLLPKSHRWDIDMMSHHKVGELFAQSKYDDFLEHGLNGYSGGRDIPSSGHASGLSVHLQFGEISPNQIWYSVRNAPMMYGKIELEKHVDKFCTQLGWRDFCHAMLYYNPDMVSKNYQRKFDAYPWGWDDDIIDVWKRGMTGIPLVDAGMRELWQTGHMQNRIRMVVASFLVKNLGQHWRSGEQWFWNTLLDASMGNNIAGWQWVAGCGADAAPYFRIFSPVSQGQRFDADGAYTRKWVPELSHMPDKYLFNPWDAPDDVLSGAGVVLGDTYPNPMVDLKHSREKALKYYKKLS